MAKAMHGIALNNWDCVDELKPRCAYTMYGPWWREMPLFHVQVGCHLYYEVPPAAAMKQMVVAHPRYAGDGSAEAIVSPPRGEWMILNEPDLENISVEKGIELVTQQVWRIREVDKTALIICGMGSQLHYQEWFEPMWKGLSSQVQLEIEAVHTHYYVQAEYGSDDASKVFNGNLVKKAMQSILTFVSKVAPGRRTFITEFGLVLEGVVGTYDGKYINDATINYIEKANRNMTDAGIERYYWYGHAVPMYASLVEGEYGKRTRTYVGHAFSGLTP